MPSVTRVIKYNSTSGYEGVCFASHPRFMMPFIPTLANSMLCEAFYCTLSRPSCLLPSLFSTHTIYELPFLAPISALRFYQLNCQDVKIACSSHSCLRISQFQSNFPIFFSYLSPGDQRCPSRKSTDWIATTEEGIMNGASFQQMASHH